MVQTIISLVIYLFFNFLSLSPIPCISSKPNSFTLKLIHRDSPLSPLYQPNISDFEHFKKHVQISESRSLFFQQMYEGETENSKISKNSTIRIPLKYDEVLFTVDIDLGTPTVQQTLIFDTGSSITWTQCTPCLKCFKQNKPIFDTGKSSSYTKITKKDNLATFFTCILSSCFYYVDYYDGKSSRGIISKDNFKFKTSTRTKYIAQLVFGCGNINFGPYKSKISGILGMDKNPVSFVRQLGKHIKPRFSYCLASRSYNTKASIVRFGEEAIIRTKNKQSSLFLKTSGKYSYYALNLRGISIGGERLRLKQDPFPNGCIIDSGSSLSLIEPESYSYVKESFERYFLKFKNVRRYDEVAAATAGRCYSYMGSFNSFPNMTYHFQGADLNIPPENVVMHYINSKYFCISMVESRGLTLLGAFQQQNTRFVYDLERDMLSFDKEDCSKDVVA